MKKLKICIIVGTRPEIIKMSPIIRECAALKKQGRLDFFILHTGQHYSYDMDALFFEELEIPDAKYNLEVGSASHGKQTGVMLEKIEEVLIMEKPDVVLVEGDTNSVLSGALAASKLRIPVGHVEAGLRSYDREMPEESNRILVDHCSSFLFAPTENARKILTREGIDQKIVFVTGNTIVDAVLQNLELADKKSSILRKLGLEKDNYFLITAHRQENVDKKQKLENLLNAFQRLHDKFGLTILYPIHPRTKKRISEFRLRIPDGLSLIKPVGFLDFLKLEANAKLVLTDSGGIQEETCILKVPCITLRENTERPETLTVGSNVLAGTNPAVIMQSVDKMLSKNRVWKNPFGDGTAGKKIIGILLKNIKK